MYGYSNPNLVKTLKNKKLTSFAMELVPRISRAQSMDVLSSQATVAGYRATLIAANTLDKFFPMLTSAAGTIRPAQVLARQGTCQSFASWQTIRPHPGQPTVT